MSTKFTLHQMQSREYAPLPMQGCMFEWLGYLVHCMKNDCSDSRKYLIAIPASHVIALFGPQPLIGE